MTQNAHGLPSVILDPRPAHDPPAPAPRLVDQVPAGRQGLAVDRPSGGPAGSAHRTLQLLEEPAVVQPAPGHQGRRGHPRRRTGNFLPLPLAVSASHSISGVNGHLLSHFDAVATM
ncbi:hypothetical protein ACH4YO_08285 [Streptomyces noursei]|uniref:hypothetical protein n=1 Tax=Streptomyces noursei TaxID=1971 RepID=UPI00340E523D